MTGIKSIEFPEPIINLAKKVFGKAEIILNDWDLDRIYISKGEEEFTIRMWNIDESSIRWTLFKDIPNEDGGSHGEERESGTYRYKYSYV